MEKNFQTLKTDEKYKKFAECYVLNNYNGSRAAELCGYTKKALGSTSTRLLKNVKVRREIAKLKRERSERTKVDADFLLKELAVMLSADIRDLYDEDGKFKAIKDLPSGIAKLISSVDVIEDAEGKNKIKRVRLTEKLKVIEQIGKHIDVQAFSEKKDISVNGQITIQSLHESIEDDITNLGLDHVKPNLGLDYARPNRSELGKRYSDELEIETPEIF